MLKFPYDLDATTRGSIILMDIGYEEREELEMQLRAVPEIEKRIAELEAGGDDS